MYCITIGSLLLSFLYAVIPNNCISKTKNFFKKENNTFKYPPDNAIKYALTKKMKEINTFRKTMCIFFAVIAIKRFALIMYMFQRLNYKGMQKTVS